MILDSFRQDVRVGLRVLFKDKVFLVLSVVVLALGIGGAMTQFAVVNAIVLRGFSFPHPEQLVSVGLIDPKADVQQNNGNLGVIPTAQDYEDIKAAQHSFSAMAAYLSGSTINVTYKDNPQRYTGGYVTEDLFKIIGVSPALGRDFSAGDDKPGAPKTLILGDEVWRRDFNADRNIIGQNVRVNGKPATIIGVMPPGFKFPTSEQVWTPYYNEWALKPRGELFIGASNPAPAVMGRLRVGVSLDQANAEMIAIARNLAVDNAKTNKDFTSGSVQPLLNAFTGVQLRQIVWAMLAAVILVLLIACVNVMNMQFGRAALRAKELAIRGALGATRWRLVRQMLTESMVVAALGAIAGTLLAYWATDMFQKSIEAGANRPPYWWQFTIDGRVLIFTLIVTVAATVVSGLLPAFISSRGNAAEIMKEGGR
ncbi:MAG: ABC transporter permease, partial [Chthoniobacterales bacterium]